jgi:uracil phosphoribosyltransferase
MSLSAVLPRPWRRTHHCDPFYASFARYNRPMALLVLDHPLAGHLLASLRDRHTPPQEFRQLARRITTLLILQATYGIRTRAATVETPICDANVRILDQGLAVVPVLRAGLGMLEPVLDLFPDVAVGYIGLERHEETAIAHKYYSKVPKSVAGRYTLCVDPMLGTGGSAAQAISLIKAHGATQITMVSIVSAPEGVANLQKHHPDVPIITGALDERLNDVKYIVPGLGDFGDRLYGTP